MTRRGLYPKRSLRRQLMWDALTFTMWSVTAGVAALAGRAPWVVLMFVAFQVAAGLAFINTQRRLARR